jgi:hypothetical protein
MRYAFLPLSHPAVSLSSHEKRKSCPRIGTDFHRGRLLCSALLLNSGAGLFEEEERGSR